MKEVDKIPKDELINNSLMTEEELLAAVESAYLENVQGLGVAVDWDGNISYGGEQTNGLDPRDSVMDPDAREAISAIIANGLPVVVLSSRGARDVARLAHIPGLSIIGTKGWETFIADSDDPTKGDSLIHPKFLPFREQIAEVLGSIRARLFENEGLSSELLDEPNIAVPTTDGTIILQRKGYNADHPEGINLTWSLNQLSIEKQDYYENLLKKYYTEAFEKYTLGWAKDKKNTLRNFCGVTTRTGIAGDKPTRDIEIGPIAQNAKGNAMIQLLLETDNPRRATNFRNLPHARTWLYSGDDIKQDVEAMCAGQRLALLSDVKGGVLGILTRPIDGPIPEGINFMVPGVSENGQLLKKVRDITIRKRPMEMKQK